MNIVNVRVHRNKPCREAHTNPVKVPGSESRSTLPTIGIIMEESRPTAVPGQLTSNRKTLTGNNSFATQAPQSFELFLPQIIFVFTSKNAEDCL